MKFIRQMHDAVEPLFTAGGPLAKLSPLYEAHDTVMFTPGTVTKGASHIRDGLDLKRMMITVVIALAPIMVLWAPWNTGYQAYRAIAGGAVPLACWQTDLWLMLGFSFEVGNAVAYWLYGLLFYVPVYIVTLVVGGFWEVLFAVVRKHEINEGFLVTSALLPLVLPPTIPLWQVALGISFGVVVAKEVFGGVGMNWLNPALASRAFLFFAYPAQISGDKVWIAAQTSTDTFSGATWLARIAESGPAALQAEGAPSLWDAFLGTIPGSMGETSTLLCIFGAIILIVTQVGSWRTMLGCLVGSGIMGILFASIGSDTNLLFNLPFYWHWVLGGFAFAAVFMATDPVSSAFTEWGKLIYGLCIGILGMLIRVVNPAYPEGWMLAILFMNMFAPFIDHWFVVSNVKRRMKRYAT